MKKIYLSVFLVSIMGGVVQAQISRGGLPWGMDASSQAATSTVAQVTLPEPDYASYEKEDHEDAISGAAKPYRVAAPVAADIDVLAQGRWFYRQDGSGILRLAVEVPGAKALSLHFDQFHLPEGVRLFISNANGLHLLGAYTGQNNSAYNVFIHEELQGNTAILELNVDKGADLQQLQLHIAKVWSYYRGVSDLSKYESASAPLAAKPTIDESSVCHVNAVCPQGAGDQFLKAKNATVRMFSGGGWCTGTLINNTGNSATGECKPYLLTASHCDGSNSRNDADFAAYVFRFNYEYLTCDGSQLPVGNNTMTGAFFRARSNNPSMASPENALVADFMLLELVDDIPEAYDAYLAGWNRNIGIWQNEDYDKYVGFHHPAGDAKKLSSATNVFPDGVFNQSAISNTHWRIAFQTGGTSGGSSGSGLFDRDGLLIGDLSGGPPATCSQDGRDFGVVGNYSKISYAWDNSYDQTTFPDFAGSASRLKDWLDPANTGAMSLGTTKYDCSDMPNAVDELEEILRSSISVYPNPSSGRVIAKLNFATPTNLTIIVTNIYGAVVGSFEISGAVAHEYGIDLSHLSSGVYLLQFSTAQAQVTQKIVLAK